MHDEVIIPYGRYGIVRQNGGVGVARIYDMASGLPVLTPHFERRLRRRHGPGRGGLASRSLDNTALAPSGGIITPGSTWRFQFLLRDAAGGALTFNSSEGLELVFAN